MDTGAATPFAKVIDCGARQSIVQVRILGGHLGTSRHSKNGIDAQDERNARVLPYFFDDKQYMCRAAKVDFVNLHRALGARSQIIGLDIEPVTIAIDEKQVVTFICQMVRTCHAKDGRRPGDDSGSVR